MQQAVDNQVRGMILDADPALQRLGGADAVRQDDVAQQHLAIVAVLGDRFHQVRLDHREGEHVGRLVLPPILAVEDMDFLVRSEAHRDFDRRGVIEPLEKGGLAKRGLGGADGERFPIRIRPGGFDQGGDVKHSGPHRLRRSGRRSDDGPRPPSRSARRRCPRRPRAAVWRRSGPRRAGRRAGRPGWDRRRSPSGCSGRSA
ncbi:conserved hypothetical protein [Ricinus communis]|uniref:Uncharacterized protein n=1 Tax=Ricinus communis TaxID=3988 RepID=B9TIG4_RICCO|nr:conserved hypothetical protein [Ricinus communis]